MESIFLASFLFTSMYVSAEELKPTINPFLAKPIDRPLIQKNECSKTADDQKLEQRGCCSHHDGVCGCGAGGHAQCCDGAQSPSCGC